MVVKRAALRRPSCARTNILATRVALAGARKPPEGPAGTQGGLGGQLSRGGVAWSQGRGPVGGSYFGAGLTRRGAGRGLRKSQSQ